jgi:hypothetical protein
VASRLAGSAWWNDCENDRRQSLAAGQPVFTSTGRHKPGLPPRSEVHGRVPLPEGYHSVNPYIVVDDAEGFIDFLVEVFGASSRDAACV